MATRNRNAKGVKAPKDKLLAKITLFFFDKPLVTAALWIVLTIVGALSYGVFMKREGFPSVNIPLAFTSGAYFVNDAAKVDEDVAKPLGEIAQEQPGVQTVQSQTGANFFTVSIVFEEGVDAKAAAESLRQAVEASGRLPQGVVVQYNVPYFGVTGGDAKKIDLAISFYDKNSQASLADLTDKASEFAAALTAKNVADVQEVFVKNPFEQTTDPATNQAVTIQRSFDRHGVREDAVTDYYSSVLVGVASVQGADIIKLDEHIRQAMSEILSQDTFAAQGFDAEITASFAPQIEDNISELQKSLLEGLLAVLIVGSIVIAIRASIITVISMITVVAMTLGFIYAIGYTLNVITLFSLILALALIVDDTIIMVEAIDAARHRHKDRRKAVQEATRKISRAMVAATLTAALSFAPLLFVGGVLGSFIRAIPVTIIASLLISLVVALIFIPFMARYLLLGPKQMGKKGVVEVAAGFEAKIAQFVTRPMIWARHSRKKLFAVGSTAVFIGLGFIIAGGLIARNVVFNIFPPTKDTNGLIVQISFAPGLSIEEAERVAGDADKLVADTLGDNFVQSSYFSTGSESSATQQIEIISYTKRDVRSPELVSQLQDRFDSEFDSAQVSVGQVDVGPPASSFIVQIDATNREAAYRVAEDMRQFMDETVLERPNGTTARYQNANVSSANQYIRDDGKPIVTVSSGFDGEDTSTLVTLATNAIKEEFSTERLATYGLGKDSVQVDLGQEQENQDSFATLALAFPLLLLVMYFLLAVQFRSLLQPLLIFLAIPFSFFGISLGLDLSNNAFSFFAMLGFFALLGLSIKNTILLTDYANQARRSGLAVVDAAVEALRERFRPLFATSMTAVVSLIPLALTSPFWEGLTVVLIFGLLSSTLLVVTVFPYYYLGAEYLRIFVGFKRFVLWLIPTGLVVFLAATTISPLAGVLVVPLSFLAMAFQRYYAQKLAR